MADGALKNRSERYLAIGALLAALAASGWFALHWTKAFNLEGLMPSGDIASGYAHGVRIGGDLGAAKATLTAGGRREFVDEGLEKLCLGERFRHDERVSVYFERSWRYGVFCLGSREGRVTRLKWRYTFALAP